MDRPAPLVASAAAMCLCAAALVSCGASGAPRAGAPPNVPDRVDLAVVAVDARIGRDTVHSSGVVIDGDRGLVVTSAHGVWGARSLKVATALGLLHGRIVARAPCADLAVVSMEPRIPGLAALPVAPGSVPGLGQLLRAIGRRRVDGPAAGNGRAEIPVRVAGRLGTRPVGGLLPAQAEAVELDSALVAEIAGGPVVDAAGRLVGMAETSGESAAGMLVPWNQIAAQLRRLQPGDRAVYAGWADEYRCAPAQHAFARSVHPGYEPADARLNAPLRPTRVPGTEQLDG